jgi:hypothetical protein
MAEYTGQNAEENATAFTKLYALQRDPQGKIKGTHSTPMSQLHYVESIYCDYLHDCYQANKRLSPDDWMWYGRELHHIEIPNCDGGKLGPLNEQYLTTYQHWVAGVLQSEVMGRLCFAYIPKGSLPSWMEDLRVKWLKSYRNKHAFPALLMAKTKKQEDYPEYKGPANGMPYALRKPNARSEKISKNRGVPILLTLPGGQILHYDSIKLACRSHSLHPGHLREVAQGKRKQHKGFTAQFITPHRG